jgi:hypothetical protein
VRPQLQNNQKKIDQRHGSSHVLSTCFASEKPGVQTESHQKKRKRKRNDNVAIDTEANITLRILCVRSSGHYSH